MAGIRSSHDGNPGMSRLKTISKLKNLPSSILLSRLLAKVYFAVNTSSRSNCVRPLQDFISAKTSESVEISHVKTAKFDNIGQFE